MAEKPNADTLGPLADWKNKGGYPTVKTHPLEIWVWEFLRRNPDYQHAWNIERANAW